jgi:hypothetical protein
VSESTRVVREPWLAPHVARTAAGNCRKSRRTPDLKGKTLSVDAMTTGYAFVLFDLLGAVVS